MAYSKGLTNIFRSKGTERATERKRYEDEIGHAEEATAEESREGSLWQTLGSAAWAAIGFVGGGPAGAYAGYHAGKEVGRWGQRISSDYDVDDYAVTTASGKWDTHAKYDLEQINRDMKAADEAGFWKDVTGTGMSAFSMLTAPDLAGSEWFADPSWNFMKKEGAEVVLEKMALDKAAKKAAKKAAGPKNYTHLFSMGGKKYGELKGKWNPKESLHGGRMGGWKPN